MSNFIDKTTYLAYLDCPKNTWFKLHKPEFKELFKPSEFEENLSQQGNYVEGIARELFQNGEVIENFGNDAVLNTQKHISQKTPFLFQATFTFDVFLARNDVLAYDTQTSTWHLYEIKSTNSFEENSKKIDHVEDVSFQAVILKENGIELSKIFSVYLNKNYVLGDFIDVKNLFIINNITEKVQDRERNTRLRMEEAKTDLFKLNEEDLSCVCIYKTRNSQCKTFKYSHVNVPEYSVHDIARIHKTKLASLVNNCIFDIDDIPDNFELSPKQKQQVNVYKQRIPFINYDLISGELESLKYPLYFFDYETYAAAIPIFKSSWPYQQIPFQFSLHVVHDPESSPIHFEYLHELNSDPSLNIIEKLQEFISQTGTIIVWYKSFEQKINIELAKRFPEHKEFLDSLNNRIYDLMSIFEKQMYIHPEFKGRTSIKKILPILAPQLSYQELDIGEGTAAASKWFSMTYDYLTPIEKQKIAYDLRAYCGLDTYAMYAIWKHLIQIKQSKAELSRNHYSKESDAHRA